MNLPADAPRRAFRLLHLATFAAALLVCFVLGFALANRWLQRAEGEIAAPDLVGKDLAAATALCQEQALTCKVAGNEPSEEQPAGAVIRQKPVAGETMRRERPLSLTISSGPREVEIPDLAQTPLDLARYLLESNELQLERVAQICGAGGRQQVLAQNPPPFARRPRNSGVSLLLSAGPCEDEFLMPQLAGLPLRQGLLEIERQGFLLPQVEYVKKEGETEGAIVDQEPAAGRWVSRRDRLLLRSTADLAGAESEARFTWLRFPLPFRFLRQKVEIRIHSPAGIGYSWEEFVAGGAFGAALWTPPGAGVAAFVEGQPAQPPGRGSFLPAIESARIGHSRR